MALTQYFSISALYFISSGRSSIGTIQPASANSGVQASFIQMTSSGSFAVNLVTSVARNCAAGKFS